MTAIHRAGSIGRDMASLRLGGIVAAALLALVAAAPVSATAPLVGDDLWVTGAHGGAQGAGEGETAKPAIAPDAVDSAIVPGTANRTSISLSATYDVKAKLRFGSRAFS